MVELDLEACPICYGQDRLFRQSLDRGGRRFIWYQCQGCGSALLWVGDDRWAYQKVGKENKEHKDHLLGQSLSTRELQALQPRAQEASPISGISDSLSDRVTLDCPSCGVRLDIASDVDRFACSFCGTKQIVKRGGALVSLHPVVEEIKHVRVGMDRPAAKRAIKRLTGEIADLERQGKEVGSTITSKRLEIAGDLIWLGVGTALAVACIAIAFVIADGVKMLIVGVGVVACLLIEGAKLEYFVRASEKAERVRTAKDGIAWRIKRKTAELERYKKLVSE